MFFVKQKTAYEVRISDWSSDVCSSDLGAGVRTADRTPAPPAPPCRTANARPPPPVARDMGGAFEIIEHPARAPGPGTQHAPIVERPRLPLVGEPDDEIGRAHV